MDTSNLLMNIFFTTTSLLGVPVPLINKLMDILRNKVKLKCMI